MLTKGPGIKGVEMKSVRWLLASLALLLALTVLGVFGAGTILAQDGMHSSPATSVYIDNETHVIPGKTTLYFRFEYNGDNSPIEVALTDGADRNLSFNVYTPEQINDSTWWLLPPIGRGTRLHGTDLGWTGKFYAPGTYYVEVQNLNDQPQNYTLTVRGPDVRLCPTSLLICPPMKLLSNEGL
jgi:hypothetical protein